MCGLALRPAPAEAARTICQTRCRVNFLPPRPRNRSGEALPFRQNRARLFHVDGQGILRAFPQRHNPFLVALAADQQISQIELQVFQFDADDLRHAQRRRIENLQHGMIADRYRLRLFAV